MESWVVEVAATLSEQSKKITKQADVPKESEENLNSQMKTAGVLAGDRKDGKDCIPSTL